MPKRVGRALAVASLREILERRFGLSMADSCTVFNYDDNGFRIAEIAFGNDRGGYSYQRSNPEPACLALILAAEEYVLAYDRKPEGDCNPKEEAAAVLEVVAYAAARARGDKLAAAAPRMLELLQAAVPNLRWAGGKAAERILADIAKIEEDVK